MDASDGQSGGRGASTAGAVTGRAVLIGLACGVGLAAVGFVNDSLLRMTQMVGNHLPVSVYGLLILALLAVNPLLRLVRRSWALRPGEWAVALCITLAAVAVATNGMVRNFGPSLVLPAKAYESGPSSVLYHRMHVLDYMPLGLIVNDGRVNDGVVKGYMTGLADQGTGVTAGDVWAAWRGPLAVWMPLMALVFIAGLCLAVIVLPQWADRERLAFPIAKFTRSLIYGHAPPDAECGEQAHRPIFRHKGFWIMLVVAMGIHLVNGYHAYNSQSIEIPLKYWAYGPIVNNFPILGQVAGAWVYFHFPLFLAVVGFSFLISREVSFTIRAAGFLHVLITAAIIKAGYNPGAGPTLGNYEGFLRIGAYVGISLAVLHAGRRYYGPLLARALGARRWASENLPVGTARVMLVCLAALVALLVWMGLAWPFAIAAVAGLMMLYLVIARINAETGLLFVAPVFGLTEIVAGVFGLEAAGPRALLMVTLFCSVAMPDIRVAITPLVINALHVVRGEHAEPAADLREADAGGDPDHPRRRRRDAAADAASPPVAVVAAAPGHRRGVGNLPGDVVQLQLHGRLVRQDRRR